MIPETDRKYFFLGRVTKGLENLTSILQPQDPASSIQSPSSDVLFSNLDYYLCSGRDVVESLKEYVYQKGAPKEQVYFEKF